MPFFSKVKSQLANILTLCEPSEPQQLQIGTPSNFHRGDYYTIEGLTEEQQAWIHSKALADASFPSTLGHRLTRSSISVMCSLPGPAPEPFCERPRQVPPFPVRRCVSNPRPHPYVRQRPSIMRSQSTGNRIDHYFPNDQVSYHRSSIYAPRYRPVRVDSIRRTRPLSDEGHSTPILDDQVSRPSSSYSMSQPSSEALPVPTPVNNPRPKSRFRPISLGSIHSLPNSRPTSLALPRFSCPAVYDQMVESDMSLVEATSFYKSQMENFDESFLKEAGALDAKSAWSTLSSFCNSSPESHHESGPEGESGDDESDDSDSWSLASTMQEAIMVNDRLCASCFVGMEVM